MLTLFGELFELGLVTFESFRLLADSKNFDCFNGVVFFYFVNHILALHDVAEDTMLAIQPRRLLMSDEELAAIAAGA